MGKRSIKDLLTPALNAVATTTSLAGVVGLVATLPAGAALLATPFALPVIVALITAASGGAMLDQISAGRKQSGKLDDIETWLKREAQSAAQNMGKESRSLDAWLLSLCTDGKPASLPEGVEQGTLAAVASILTKAQDEIKDELGSNALLTTSLAGAVKQHLPELRAYAEAHTQKLESLSLDLTELDRTAGVILSEVAKVVASGDRLEQGQAEMLARIAGIEHGTTQVDAYLRDRDAPPLYLPIGSVSEIDRFRAASRRVRMLGRDEEIGLLKEFLKAEGGFLWAAWAGPGGAGKSRLALEFCLGHAPGWTAGFYDWDVGRDVAWDLWEPEGPTLIVFDYVVQHAEEIRSAMRALMKRRLDPARPVRFLLLERPTPGMPCYNRESRQADGPFGVESSVSPAVNDWWEIISDGTGASCHERDSAGRPRGRALSGVPGHALRDVLSEVACSRGKEATEALLDRWVSEVKRIDPELRPLHIAFAVEAVGDDSLPAKWSARDLVECMLRRERERFWKPALAGLAVDRRARFEHLLTLATMCGGLNLGEPGEPGEPGERLLDVADQACALPTDVEYGDGSVYGGLARGSDEATAAPLQPDMLGECFVLGALSKAAKAPNPALIALAKRRFAKAYQAFMMRAVQSFPDHDALWHLLGLGEDPEAEWIVLGPLMRWSDTLLDSEHPDRAKVNERIISAQTASPPMRACAIFNAIDDWGANPRTNRLLGELHELIVAHPEDDEVRKSFVLSRCNAIRACGSDHHRADELRGDLRRLAEADPEDSVVLSAFATGLSILILRGEANINRVGELLSELRRLATRYSENADIGACLVASLGFLVSREKDSVTRLRNAEEAIGYLDRLTPEEFSKQPIALWLQTLPHFRKDSDEDLSARWDAVEQAFRDTAIRLGIDPDNPQAPPDAEPDPA